MSLRDLKIEKHRVRAKGLTPSPFLKGGCPHPLCQGAINVLKVNKYFYEIKMDSIDYLHSFLKHTLPMGTL